MNQDFIVVNKKGQRLSHHSFYEFKDSENLIEYYLIRIRVEKRPDEDFTRFYPEVKRYKGKNVYHEWINTQIPCEIRWYKTQDECEKHIENLYNWDKNFDDSYTTEIIKYPKQIEKDSKRKRRWKV